MSEQPDTATAKTNGSFLVALGIFLSRIAGLIRDRVFAHYLGNSEAAGAFRAALRIPNFLQNLFGEGVLSASFIPVYSRLLSQNSPLASEVAGIVGAGLAIIVSFLVALGVFFTPLLVAIIAPGFDEGAKELTIELVRILFPGVGLLVMSAWCLGILNSHRKFFISYSAPVLWNLSLIAALLYFGHDITQNDLVTKLAWGSVVGSFLQFAVQLPFVFKLTKGIPLKFNFSLQPVRNIFLNLGPVIIGRGVVQISAYIDSMIASFLGTAAVSCIAYAQTIYLLPISLFGMAVAAAELPGMSVAADDANQQRLKSRIINSRKQIAFFVVPSAVLLFFLGNFVVEALYQTGHFSPEDTLYVWYVLTGSAIGLLAATWGRLYGSVFYALQDTKTPLKIALFRVLISVGLGLLLAFPLRDEVTQILLQIPGLRLPDIPNINISIGALGLALGSSVAGWIEFLILKFLLAKRLGPTPVEGVHLVKLWVSALIAAVLSIAAGHFVLQKISLQVIGYNLVPLLIICLFGSIYLLLSLSLKIKEATNVAKKFRLIR